MRRVECARSIVANLHAVVTEREVVLPRAEGDAPVTQYGVVERTKRNLKQATRGLGAMLSLKDTFDGFATGTEIIYQRQIKVKAGL